MTWMCKKQTSVSHSSTESEIRSLDVGLRKDGIPALDLWYVVIKVLRSFNTNTPTTQNNSANEGRVKNQRETAVSTSNVNLRKEGNKNVDELSNFDHVATHANFSQCNPQLYILEDNEAVIKMIIKGRSPMMRHASRTHRIALDRTESTWTPRFKSNMLTPKTKHQRKFYA